VACVSLRPASSVEHKSRIGALAGSKDGDGPEAPAVATGYIRLRIQPVDATH